MCRTTKETFGADKKKGKGESYSRGDQGMVPQAKGLAHLGNGGGRTASVASGIQGMWSNNLWPSFLPRGVYTIGIGSDSPGCSQRIDAERLGTELGLEHLVTEQVPGSPVAVCGIKHGDSLQAEMLLFKQPPTGTDQVSLSQQETLGGT